MSSFALKLKPENVDKYVKSVPYVKVYAGGTIDYCLGSNYDQAGKVIRTLLELKEKTKKL